MNNISTQKLPTKKMTQYEKYNAVKKLSNKGMNVTEIADKAGITRKTVYHYLEQIQQDKEIIKQFDSQRVDSYKRIQLKSRTERERILDSMMSDDISELTPDAKRARYLSLTTCEGIDHDHERLEQGKSTQNISYHVMSSEIIEIENEISRLQTIDMVDVSNSVADKQHYVNLKGQEVSHEKSIEKDTVYEKSDSGGGG